jgi:DNA-3-methyladenine glycosylase I
MTDSGKTRCAWAGPEGSLYRAYHDLEWGVPVFDDRLLFEFVILEGFQAGLSWAVILNKREHFRLAFDGFRPEKMAAYGEAEIGRLLANADIVRNRLKITAAIKNARAFLDMKASGIRFSDFLWQFVGGRPVVNHWQDMKSLPCRSGASDAMSRELKSRGCSFVGSTICYALMQAVGMVNDHVVDCFRHREITETY